MFEKYYVLLPAPGKPNPPAPLPYEGMGVISLSPFRREVWREVPSIVIDAFLHPLRPCVFLGLLIEIKNQKMEVLYLAVDTTV